MLVINISFCLININAQLIVFYSLIKRRVSSFIYPTQIRWRNDNKRQEEKFRRSYVRKEAEIIFF